jgi:hypothetical protein
MQKFIFLYLLVIWFFTARDWWNKAILVPIGMLLYQITILLNDDIKFKDEAIIDKYILIPLIILICCILYYIREKMSFYISVLNLKNTVEEEIAQIKNQMND